MSMSIGESYGIPICESFYTTFEKKENIDKQEIIEGTPKEKPKNIPKEMSKELEGLKENIQQGKVSKENLEPLKVLIEGVQRCAKEIAKKSGFTDSNTWNGISLQCRQDIQEINKLQETEREKKQEISEDEIESGYDESEMSEALDEREEELSDEIKKLRQLASDNIINKIEKNKIDLYGFAYILSDPKRSPVDKREIQFYRDFYEKNQKNLEKIEEFRKMSSEDIIAKIKVGEITAEELPLILINRKRSYQEKHLIFLENFLRTYESKELTEGLPFEKMEKTPTYRIEGKELVVSLLLNEMFNMLDNVAMKSQDEVYKYTLGCTEKELENSYSRQDMEAYNRYSNIYPYDNFRAIIHSHLPDNTYFNASIFGKYIASMGPFCDPKVALSDFFQLIWQYEAAGVMSLGSPVEGNRDKYDEWFSEEKLLAYNSDETVPFKIELQEFEDGKKVHCFDSSGNPVEEEKGSALAVRLIKITDKATGETRIAPHFACYAASDHNVPPKEIFDLIERLRNEMGITGKPHVAHCSAGAGRTGMFLSYFILHDLISGIDPKELGIHIGMTREEIIANPTQATLRLVLLLRLRRPQTVQTIIQLGFLIDRVRELAEKRKAI